MFTHGYRIEVNIFHISLTNEKGEEKTMTDDNEKEMRAPLK